MIAALALAGIAALTGNTGTLWVGPQAVTVSVAVTSSYAGMPRACVRNNGPDPIRVVTLKVTDATHTLTARGRTLKAGQTQCLTRGRIRVAGAYVTAAAVDQRTGGHGRAELLVRNRLEPVRPVSLVARVQAAAGHLAADGDYGPLTSARLKHIRANWRSMPATVARVQRAYGVTPDGIWGARTEDAYELLRNAAYGRY